MFITSFKITSFAVAEIFLVAAIGYFLVKRQILSHQGLDALSRLVIEITLPLMIFSKLIRDFKFDLYPNWWIFPLISIGVTSFGLLSGLLFSLFFKEQDKRAQFISLSGFQNSGYLPLALAGALLALPQAQTMFIYLFLFLMGFNLVMFSFGVHLLTFKKNKRFELASLFSPPVIAVISTLILIFFRLDRFIPGVVLRPLEQLGDCTLPLAMIVVGGNLAQMRLGHTDIKAMFLLTLAKMILLPLAGLLLLLKFQLPYLVGLLILMQLAMPSATSLSVIIRHYKKDDLLISQGVLLSHIISVVTIPVFLSLYLARAVLK